MIALKEIYNVAQEKIFTETYISTDIEADGPIPGPHNMLSLGSAAFSRDGKLISTFEVNLKEMPGTTMAPNTKKFWDRFPEAYKASRENAIDPKIGMERYVKWLNTLPGRPVFVAYPAGFDFTFVLWYLTKFTGGSPFGHAALDIKTYGMAVMNKEYRKSTKKGMPARWFPKLPHTHVALDDAIEQGYLFMNILKERQKLDAIDK